MEGGGGKGPLAWPEPLGETLLGVKLNMLSENRQRGFSGGEVDFFWGGVWRVLISPVEQHTDAIERFGSTVDHSFTEVITPTLYSTEVSH